MKNVSIDESKEKLKVFETILCSPGMNEKCKIPLTISRQNILLLGRLIDAGLVADKNLLGDEILSALPADSLSDLKAIQLEILEKGGLTNFYEKLKLL